MALAAWWLQNCRSTHPRCQSPRDNFKELPTRLVDLDTSGLRLCSLVGEPMLHPYATLSHCWGSKHYVLLTKENLASFYTGIPMASLSRIVIDAISIARKMGFRYLWIDTLCIVQDDPEDWEREASRMSQVYGSAALNIAASSAKDGSEGCFYEDLGISRCRVDVDVGGISCRHEIVSKDFAYAHLEQSPLLRRGWVLQERLLSQRMIHFTRLEMFWECHQGYASETFPCGIPESLMEISFPKTPLEEYMWPLIVRNYSRCKFTYAKDKLVALSGVARHIQDYSDSQPRGILKGMFSESMEQQLCWLVSPGLEPQGRYHSSVAPTWSWASINGPIETMNWSSIPEPSIYCAASFKENDDKSTLYMACKMLIPYSDFDGTNIATDASGSRGSGLSACEGEAADDSGIVVLFHSHRMNDPSVAIKVASQEPYIAEGEYGLRLNAIALDLGDLRYGVTVKLEVAESQSSDPIPSTRFALPLMQDDGLIHGIVLERSHNGRGVYTRIGYFNC